MKWEVFNTHTADTICHVPFRWIAKLLCRVDKTWDYDTKGDKYLKQQPRRNYTGEGGHGKSEPS